MGFRWVLFQVGDSTLLIDLNALKAEGEYIFRVNPNGTGRQADVTVWYEEQEILQLQNGSFTGLRAEQLKQAIHILEATAERAEDGVNPVYESFSNFASDLNASANQSV